MRHPRSTSSTLAAITLALTLSHPTFAADVKMSRSKICHTPGSSYYERTKNYTAFASLEQCLSSGGRLPKSASSAQTQSSTGSSTRYAHTTSSQPNSSSSNTIPRYKREYFGKGWADTDGDCQNSRHEALIAQSTAPVRFKSGRNCRVTAGRWVSPFTGAVIHDPRQIDIDHVTPLAWAWKHGAYAWSSAQREAFANDPVNLWSVEASLNRQKGASGPDEWLPPTNQCGYVSRFLRVAKTYRLNISAAEDRRFRDIKERVCGK